MDAATNTLMEIIFSHYIDYIIMCLCVCVNIFGIAQTFSLTNKKIWQTARANCCRKIWRTARTHLEIFIMLSRDVYFFLIRFHSILKRCHLFFAVPSQMTHIVSFGMRSELFFLTTELANKF